jgi:hypothetical protein
MLRITDELLSTLVEPLPEGSFLPNSWSSSSVSF